MRRPCRQALLAIIGLGLAACTLASPVPSQPAAAGPQPVPGGSRTLVAVVRVEPESAALRPIQGGRFEGFGFTRRLFNAELALFDERLIPHPYLSVALPQLNSETWRVFPDGQMETTWRLRPGVVWHDGVPLSAQDFVFAWRVYAAPEFGVASTAPFPAIHEVVAADDRTLVIRWRQLYADAASLTGTRAIRVLPRHLLELSFQEASPDAFANAAYWTREYIGLGPYRLDRWEPGSFLEAGAFDQHVLGRPKMGRIQVRFISEVNTALANILAGEVHFVDTAIGLEQAWTLQREWEPRGAGSVFFQPNLWRGPAFQLRPEFATPRSILDVRVRKALAHAVDKQSITDSIYQGVMAVADFMISPTSARWGSAVASGVVKYPYDLRRSEQLMNEAGFVKGSDGLFASPTEGRFASELKTAASPQWEGEVLIMASDWRKAGFDVQSAVLPRALSTDPESRVTFPGMFTSSQSLGDQTMVVYTTAQIPRAENRWRGGNNRGGWSNPEYDQFANAFSMTLEPSERAQQVTQMARIFTDELPVISLMFVTQPYAYVAALRGIMPVAESDLTWNIHEWELQ